MGTFLIVVFCAILVWQGILSLRHTKTSDDFNVAGRRMGPLLISATVTASICSTSTYLGFGGWIYRDGTGVYAISVAVALCLAAAAIFIVGPVREYGKITISDFLGDRYHSDMVRVLTSVIVIVVTLGVAVAATIGMGLVVAELTGLSYTWAVVLAVIIAGGYSLLGGVLSVIWTDALQLAVMIAAVVIGLPAALAAAGGGSTVVGFERVLALASEGWFTWNGANGSIAPSLLVGQVILWTLGGAVLPYIFTRAMVGRTRLDSIQGFALAIPLYLVFIMIPLILILGATRVGLPGITNTDTAFIQLATKLVNPAFGYPLLLAMLAAGLSSLDTQMLVTGQAFSIDIYSRVINRQATDAERLRVSRWSVGASSLAILILALAKPAGIFWVASAAIAIGGVSLFVPMVFGIYWRRGTGLGALAAVVAGPLIFVPLALFKVPLSSLGVFGHPVVPAVVVSLVLYLTVSAVTQADPHGLAVFEKVQRGRVI